MYTEKVTAFLSKNIEDKELSSFVGLVEQHTKDPAVGPLMEDLLREWKQLQVAKKSGLMDDEQVFFAIRAYFNRKKNDIHRMLENQPYSKSGNLDS